MPGNDTQEANADTLGVLIAVLRHAIHDQREAVGWPFGIFPADSVIQEVLRELGTQCAFKPIVSCGFDGPEVHRVGWYTQFKYANYQAVNFKSDVEKFIFGLGYKY